MSVGQQRNPTNPKYNVDSMPSSKNYYIDVRYSDEIKRDTYIAINRETGLGEFPFTLYGDTRQVLSELEANHAEGSENTKPKAVASVSKLSH